jgi:hypothetical protein
MENTTPTANTDAALTTPVFTDRPELAAPFRTLCADLRQGIDAGRFAPAPVHLDANGEPIDLSGRTPAACVPLDPIARAHVVMLAERFEEQLTALQFLLRSGYHPDSAKPLRDRMNMLGEYVPANVNGRADQELPAILNELDEQFRADD